MEEKLNYGFASVFTVKSVGHIAIPASLFSRRESEELSQMEVTRDEILNLLGKLQTDVSRF